MTNWWKEKEREHEEWNVRQEGKEEGEDEKVQREKEERRER